MDKILDNLEDLGIRLERLTSTLCLLMDEVTGRLPEGDSIADRRRNLIATSVYSMCVEMSENAEAQIDTIIDQMIKVRKEIAA